MPGAGLEPATKTFARGLLYPTELPGHMKALRDHAWGFRLCTLLCGVTPVKNCDGGVWLRPNPVSPAVPFQPTFTLELATLNQVRLHTHG